MSTTTDPGEPEVEVAPAMALMGKFAPALALVSDAPVDLLIRSWKSYFEPVSLLKMTFAVTAGTPLSLRPTTTTRKWLYVAGMLPPRIVFVSNDVAVVPSTWL